MPREVEKFYNIMEDTRTALMMCIKREYGCTPLNGSACGRASCTCERRAKQALAAAETLRVQQP